MKLASGALSSIRHEFLKIEITDLRLEVSAGQRTLQSGGPSVTQDIGPAQRRAVRSGQLDDMTCRGHCLVEDDFQHDSRFWAREPPASDESEAKNSGRRAHAAAALRSWFAATALAASLER